MVHWLALFPLCTALARGGYERSRILRLLSSYAQYHTAMGSSIASAQFIMYLQEMQESKPTRGERDGPGNVFLDPAQVD
jgi:hypothetical protein